MSWKTSLLVIFELLRRLFKTLTADGKYSSCNIQNVPALIQMQLSKKVKPVCKLFSLFLISASNFNDLEKKDHYCSLYISEVTGYERHRWTNVEIMRFQSTLRQSTRQSLPNTYHICTTALLSYFFINLRTIDLQIIYVSDILTLRTLC